MAESKHPFLTGMAVGALGLLVWFKRGWIISKFQRISNAIFHGPSEFLPPPPTSGPIEAVARHLKRYTFASMQDNSPVVGLTHACYALMCLDLIEENGGAALMKKLGYDPVEVRTLITKLQDQHATKLNGCDPFLQETLDLQRKVV